MAKVRQRGYVRSGDVKILTHYFYINKGEDIRMVYNGTSSGLNDALWETQFALPTVASMLISVEVGTYIAERYTGEMFLKSMLSEVVRHFCGVDVSNVRTEEEWERYK